MGPVERAQDTVSGELGDPAALVVDDIADDRLIRARRLDGSFVSVRPHHVLPAPDVGEEQRDDGPVVADAVESVRRRELLWKSRDDELEQSLRPEDVLERVLAEVEQLDSVELEVLHDSRRCVREEDLTAMPGGADPRGAVDADADVALLVHEGLGRVDAHTHADLVGAVLQCPLRVDRGRDRRSGPLEGHEEPVARGVYLVASMTVERLAKHEPMPAAYIAEPGAQPSRELGGSLDVGEQKGHRAVRKAGLVSRHVRIVATRRRGGNRWFH